MKIRWKPRGRTSRGFFDSLGKAKEVKKVKEDPPLEKPHSDGSSPCFATLVSVSPEAPPPTGVKRQSVVISLGDGIGGLAASIKKANITHITRYIAVEKNGTLRRIASHAHPPTKDFCGIDHSLTDIFDIDEDFIESFPEGSLVLVSGSGDYNDFMPPHPLNEGNDHIVPSNAQHKEDAYIIDPRPGLQGQSGQTVLQIIRIWKWVLKHHPNTALLNESVIFKYMPSDWNFVNANLGEPLIISSQDYSTTKHIRAYWHNSKTLRQVPNAWVKEGMSPINPDLCMDYGRTIIRYEAESRFCVGPLSADWEGDPENPVCTARTRIMVLDASLSGKQVEIRPIEAERLMGFPENSTNAPGVTAKERLKALANSWDINVTSALIKSILISSDQRTRINLLVPKNLTNDDLTRYEIAKAFFTSADEVKWLILCEVTDEELGKMAAIYTKFPNGLPEWYASIVEGSAIDSGAEKHMCSSAVITDMCMGSSAVITDADDRAQDTQGNHVDVDIDDVESFPGATAYLISMGRLIRAKWDFRLNNQKLEATIPSGRQVNLKLNSQEVLMMPHETHTEKEASPLTGASTPMNTINSDIEEPKPESNLTGTGYISVPSMFRKKIAELYKPSPMFFEAFSDWPDGPSWRSRHKVTLPAGYSYDPETGRPVRDNQYYID